MKQNSCNVMSSMARESILSESSISSCLAKEKAANSRSKYNRLNRSWLFSLVRLAAIEFPLTLLFVALVAVVSLHHVHDKYLLPQIRLMVFQKDLRDFRESGYYHRFCTSDDISATNISQLLIPADYTGDECATHQMIHGASVYRDLLTPETSQQLRDLILEGNMKQKMLPVLENEFRYSWAIDVNMHPAFKTFWKELASHPNFADGLQAIVGPDPAVIEFTAITAVYGAKAQVDHPDVLSEASATKFPNTYMPSYSLFIPLQDTSKEMGATHVCPGSHLCGDGAHDVCFTHSLSMAGDDDNWRTGWGILINQQTLHKGMSHTKKDGLERVVIIVTFAPRPQTFRKLETRTISQGGTYSMPWSQWGHTFYDYVYAKERMWEPLKTLRALGLWKCRGWNWISISSMQIANDELGDEDGNLQVNFLPKSWQGKLHDGDENIITDDFYRFMIGTITRTKLGLITTYRMAIMAFLIIYFSLDLICGNFSLGRLSIHSSNLGRGIFRMIILNGTVVLLAYWGLKTIDDSNWAKDIVTGKSFRLPELPLENGRNRREAEKLAVLPTKTDILLVPHYSSDSLAAYGRVIDLAHPGNVKWNELTNMYTQGYLMLSNQLQQEFCQSLVAYVRQDARFLKQCDEREWLVITDADELLDICHQDLVKASDEKTASMIRQLNSLKMDMKYGRFRSTILQRDVNSQYLKQWEQVLVPQRRRALQKTLQTKPRNLLQRGMTVARIHRTAPSRIMRKSWRPPKSLQPQEPYPLAWIREGDVVEALPECFGNTESQLFYRASVKAIVSSIAAIILEFHHDRLRAVLEPHCLRPLQSFYIGERVQVAVGSNAATRWLDGVIVEVASTMNESLSIHVEISNEIVTNLRPQDIRRFDTKLFKIGDWIAVIDGEESCEGKILHAYPGGTFGIRCLDGEIKANVPAIRMQRYKSRKSN